MKKNIIRIFTLLIAFAIVIAGSGLIAVQSEAATQVPGIEIDFSDESQLDTYFIIPPSSNSTWEIIDGQLVQTTERKNVEPLGDESTVQFITMKGLNLTDYVIQFDYQVCTPLEAAEEYYYGKYVVLATNVPDGNEFANLSLNGGYGYVFSDPKTTGGNKKLEMYILDKEPANNVNPYSIANIKKLEKFDIAGNHTIRIQKRGKDIQVFHKGPEDAELINLNTIEGDRQIISPEINPEAAEQMIFENPGAVQFIAGNGVIRIDNSIVESNEIDFETIPGAVQTTVELLEAGEIEPTTEPESSDSSIDEEPTVTTAEQSSETDEDDGNSSVTVAIIVVILVLIVAGLVFVLKRKK